MLFAAPGMIQAFHFDFSGPTLSEWFGLGLWGLGPLAIGTLIWFEGLEEVPASTASGFMGAMPATGLILSYVWLGDQFYATHLAGFAMVFASIALVTWAHRLNERRQDAEQPAATDGVVD